MLKALELNGFKSFADRTRFEFPEGITTVVGPNGSGKSNIVDAIKWVLGSQSAKSLRGKEMTDVIFSGTRNRKQTNSAEVSLVFDNSTGILEYDADEVQITRRVYRSGEGEYLINRQPVRLRDIKEIFAGTGVSTGAYSIIEQGKVDALLQSSPKERRLIFEEAAGVSRFKLKRQEAARRLERVEQNLLRLSDIVDELDSRLRSVRSQAGRAKKYKEQSDRLKTLRTQVALVDWQSLSEKLQTLQEQTLQSKTSVESLQQKASECEKKLSEVEEQVDEIQLEINSKRDQAATVRERVAQYESTRRSELARCDELQEETLRLRKQILTMSSKAGDAEQLVLETTKQLDTAETEYHDHFARVESQQSKLDSAKEALHASREKLEHQRAEHSRVFREASLQENQIHAMESQRVQSLADSERLSEILAGALEQRQELSQQRENVRQALQESERQTEEASQKLTGLQKKLRNERQLLAEAQSNLADLRGRLTGAKERAVVLEELERRLDGLSAGTKEVLRLSREEPEGPFGCVKGVVADLLHVDADTASLVETALGDRANQLLIEKVEQSFLSLPETAWAGRTSFLRLDVALPASAVDRIDLSAERGVVGRADQFVEAAPELATLVRRLLGRWWFVDSLETAMRLSAGIGRGLNYVTVVGEVVGADGILVVGPRQSTTGLLSRRSELRALVDEIQEMDSQAHQQETLRSELEGSIQADERLLEILTDQHKKLSDKLGKTQLQYASIRERSEQADRHHSTTESDLKASQSKFEDSEAQLESIRTGLSQQQDQLEELSRSIEDETKSQTDLEKQVTDFQKQVTDGRVALARSEQRRDGLRLQMEQLLRDHEEHDRALADTRRRDIECLEQQEKLKLSVLHLGSELAELYLARETMTAALEATTQQHAEIRSCRSGLLSGAEQARKELLQEQSALQKLELKLQQAIHKRKDIASRMKDDYQVEMGVLAATTPKVEIESRQEIDREIDSLRQRLQGIGPVNSEALSELEALEERHQTISTQYEDLRKAKTRLQQLVSQINVESRELFVRALDVIREQFQELYSNLFGGGEADIIIDDKENEDVLECGIEIVARPPGKQPRSISLLSGGERTLTCVALLLAIFRSRPSPFCVLDEVDAALDEANIARFVEVLKDFMSSTQFLVVTHSKRTMSCADTIYGITMQESGISKRVSVRFEDVSRDGHIHLPENTNKAA